MSAVQYIGRLVCTDAERETAVKAATAPVTDRAATDKLQCG